MTAGRLWIERRYTRSYRPRTVGKAERFIQTLLTEWAYAPSYGWWTPRTGGIGLMRVACEAAALRAPAP
jgi:hypothetical protein